MKRIVTALAFALVCGLPGSQAAADPITIGFGPTLPFPRPPDVPFSSYSESGFDVVPVLATWQLRHTYGAPAPFPFFRAHTYLAPPESGAVAVTDDGGLFTFWSVDLYSSVTQIPWEFAGFRDSVEIFRVTGLMGNTLGTFKTAPNPHASDSIDRLVITLTQPMNTSCPTCSGNPMGIDNIVVERVPEPAVMMLVALGLVAAQRRRCHGASRDL